MTSIPFSSRFSRTLSDELNAGQLPRSVVAGILLYVLEMILSISFAALIFTGTLSSEISFGVGVLIVGNAVLVAAVSLLSSYPGSMATEQDTTTAILALAAGGLVAALPLSATPGQQLATVIAMMIATTLVTGLVFLLLGVFRLGGLVRFLPYPVIGGFLAGTGWLLVTGGVGVMVDAPLDLRLLHPNLLSHWLPGALLGIGMLVGVVRINHPLVLPGLFVAGIVVFYVVSLLTGTSVDTLSREHWLLGPFPSGNLAHFPLTPDLIRQVNWDVLIGQIPSLLPIPAVAVISVLLNANGIELMIKRDISLNRELVAAGVGNLLGAVVGASVGYHAISITGLNQVLVSGKRLPGLLAAALILVTAFVGASPLGYIPRMMLGGILIFLGLNLLFEWIFRAWFNFSRVDFAIIVLITVVIATTGFLEGIAVGLVLTTVLFVLSYSRINVVKNAISGTDYHSRVTRTARERQILAERCQHIYILTLHGYIFFGTANKLLEQVKADVKNLPPIRYILLDFAQVADLDATALLGFSRMRQWARESDVTLVFTGLEGRVHDRFTRAGYVDRSEHLCLFADLDHGLEWCENQLIHAATEAPDAPGSLYEHFAAILPGESRLAALVAAMERRALASGEVLIQQDDDPGQVFFIESGQVTALMEQRGKPTMRLETARGGHAVGELGFYLGAKRAASVIADEPTIVYALSIERLAALEADDPQAASALHRIVVHLLGERVIRLIRTVDAFQR